MSSSYAESIEAARRVAAAQNEKKKAKRDVGLSANITAELRGALEEPPGAESSRPVAPTPSATTASAAVARVVPPTVAPATTEPVPPPQPSTAMPTPGTARERQATKPELPADPGMAIVRQGVDFRRAHLDLITEMLYRCYQRRIRLPGKRGPSLIVRAALDELATVYAADPERFDAIMERYAQKKSA